LQPVLLVSINQVMTVNKEKGNSSATKTPSPWPRPDFQRVGLYLRI